MTTIKLAFIFLVEYARARYYRFVSREKLEHYQQTQIRPFLQFVRRHSPFYRKDWQSFSDEQWRSFPLMDKARMMNHFSELNTVGIDRDKALALALAAEQYRDFTPTLNGITIGLSSGTSGHRGLFLVSPQEQARWAGMVLGKLLPTSLFWGQKERIAFFLRANSNLYESVNRARIQFTFYDLLQGVDVHFEKLQQQQPTLLIAPASVLCMLATAKHDGHLDDLKPRKIIAVAEVLEPRDQHYIERVFGQMVHQVYQCTEGFLGSTCEYGTVHLNESHVIIEREYLDQERTRFVPIVTDFRRVTQPIVRYRLNDVLRLRTEPCPCGSSFTAIEAIEGRCDDVLYLADRVSGQPKVVFADFIRRALLNVNQPIAEYMVEQTSIDGLTVFLQLEQTVHSHEKMREAVRIDVIAHLMRMCAELKVTCPTVTVSFTYPQLPSGTKLRRIKRSFVVDGVV